ncbi:MAG: 4-alpha-glucanotransferase [Anaerolineae bacterium]|nr:4-alpha-glucanotransferase [Anaerolineae bacterium]
MLEPPREPEPEVSVEPAPSRVSGVLLHITSLPGRYGIGDLGDAAYRFVDYLDSCRQQVWQIMPLGPTSYGDSPYQALSAFAGNPLLINLESLVELRCLAPWDFDQAPDFSIGSVEYGPVINFRQRLLRLSYDNFKANASDTLKRELADYIAANDWWLEDYALFAALKEQHGGTAWSSWEHDIATHQPEAVAHWRTALTDQVAYHRYLQFLFDRQWRALKAYANEHGIRIMGDVPIFISYDSADAWAHPELFHFDDQGIPTMVAGVPPDYFSPTGQLWGNPLYDWDAMARTGYAWWIDRFKRAFQQVDIVRLDHFRGFEACWAVPATETTALNGEWLKTPGLELFQTVQEVLGPLHFVAEDLGLITPEVEALRQACGFPGMKVLQFAFSGDPDNLYLPHNYEPDCVVYTGTHDNDTSLGWLNTAGEEVHSALRRYLGRAYEERNWALIRLALLSVARTAIIPLQDILSIGSEGRMNTPGRASGNWGWRFTQDMLTTEAANRLAELTEISGRGRYTSPVHR